MTKHFAVASANHPAPQPVGIYQHPAELLGEGITNTRYSLAEDWEAEDTKAELIANTDGVRYSLAEDWEGEPTEPMPAVNAMTAYDTMGEHSLAQDWEKVQ